MSKDIDYLRERHKELLKAKAEKEERDRLLSEIRDMEEEGTLKSKLKIGLKKIRSKLHEKGRKLKEDGDKLSKGSSPSNQNSIGWRPAIAEMASQSEFKGVKAEEARWEPPIAKMVKK